MPKSIPFSPGEQRLIAILADEPEPLTTPMLVQRFYRGRRTPPCAAQSVIALVRSLAKKTLRSKEFRVKRSRRSGPYPIEIWIEKRVPAEPHPTEAHEGP